MLFCKWGVVNCTPVEAWNVKNLDILLCYPGPHEHATSINGNRNIVLL